MNIIIKEKNVYGTVVYYPVCPKASLLTHLTGNKTLTVEKLRLISQLGYIIDTEEDEKPWLAA